MAFDSDDEKPYEFVWLLKMMMRKWIRMVFDNDDEKPYEFLWFSDRDEEPQEPGHHLELDPTYEGMEDATAVGRARTWPRASTREAQGGRVSLSA